MQQLNLPSYSFSIKTIKDKPYIFDTQRRRYVSLTPEEWVRQHFIQFLIQDKNYPSAYLAIEKELKMNGMRKRCDAILYNERAEPIIIIEIKAAHVPITQATFDQVAVYNTSLQVVYLMVSNGLQHYCCKIDSKNAQYLFLPEIPSYPFFLENTPK